MTADMNATFTIISVDYLSGYAKAADESLARLEEAARRVNREGRKSQKQQTRRRANQRWNKKRRRR